MHALQSSAQVPQQKQQQKHQEGPLATKAKIEPKLCHASSMHLHALDKPSLEL